MSASGLEEFLGRHQLIGLDSSILIYFIEGHPAYIQHMQSLFTAIEADRNHAVCATLSLLEVLVQPYRKKDDALVNQFYALLTTYPNIAWEGLSLEIADLGAQIRARYNLKTPDAIMLATAIHAGATGFVANDGQLKRVTEVEVLLLEG